MKLYDGKKMVNIEMNNWTGNGYTPDWSIDFFEAGNLEYDEDLESYIVEDVAYCIEQAMDWKNADGDFYEPDTDTSNRNVDVEEIDVPEATSVAFRIRTADTWDADDCEALCKLAGMEQEWEAADGETFEQVVQKAAVRLGVEI